MPGFGLAGSSKFEDFASVRAERQLGSRLGPKAALLRGDSVDYFRSKTASDQPNLRSGVTFEMLASAG